MDVSLLRNGKNINIVVSDSADKSSREVYYSLFQLSPPLSMVEVTALLAVYKR